MAARLSEVRASSPAGCPSGMTSRSMPGHSSTAARSNASAPQRYSRPPTARGGPLGYGAELRPRWARSVALVPLRGATTSQPRRRYVWRCRPLHLRDLIADERRVARLQIEDDGILLDYSRQRLTTKTVQLLLALAQATGLQAKIRAMAAGEEINYTEGRPVLHMALRAPRGDKLEVDGVDVIAQVHAPTLPYPYPYPYSYPYPYPYPYP